MTITESRLKEGTLKIGTAPDELDLSCQLTNARITSSYDDDGDAVETLCGDMIAAGRKLSGRAVAGTFIQDFTDDAASILAYLFEHDLEEVAFTYTPNEDGPTATGSVRLEVPAEAWGGDVNTRITSDFEWQITTAITWTPAAAAVGASSSQSQSTPEPVA